ncbi:MAG TPA: YhjD/YihY/BrkB family envelope integrity protein [Chlamydiales bacterium]|nr:YhjD/YihY/BrkB family envelope integrity protein [Chlamydiales bacterium]
MIRFWEILKVLFFRFRKDLCFLRASALTFTSALAFVPVLAVMFGVAKGFGLDELLQNMLLAEFRDQEEVMGYLIYFGYELLEQARGGLIAGVGIITLFYTVLRLLSTIEDSLNAMWGLKQGRSLHRKVVDFLALILLLPIFCIISSSATVFVAAKFATWNQPILVKGLRILPYIMSSMIFTFLYMYMPHVKVKLRSALAAGIATGIAFQLLQAWYITIQILLTRTGAIYGSFAAVPLFLLWLYCSWVIFLLGAELVVLHQERLWDPKIFAPIRPLTRFEKELVFVAITKAAIDAFLQEQSPLPIKELAQKLGMPVRLVTELVEELENAKIILKTDSAIILAKDPETLRLFDVIIKAAGTNEINSPLFTKLAKEVEALEKPMMTSEQNILIKNLAIS